MAISTGDEDFLHDSSHASDESEQLMLIDRAISVKRAALEEIRVSIQKMEGADREELGENLEAAEVKRHVHSKR